ncbi:MAG TPA: hypothetical protein VKZ84_03345 [Bacteriovoracaceae bacterium]|nr:hypothetical protein [Bacteriovoracaceae bacterium]
MNIEETYQSILSDLSAGGRGLRRYDANELKHLEKELTTTNPVELKKAICLVEHSAAFHPPFAEPLLHILRNNSDPEILVFALNGARKHILAYHQQQGRRLEYSFLEVLQKLLYSKHPEVVEWTLRTIEEMGAQGIFFLKEFNNIKPPPWKWFNEHNRSIREIIAMLEQRWSPK